MTLFDLHFEHQKRLEYLLDKYQNWNEDNSTQDKSALLMAMESERETLRKIREGIAMSWMFEEDIGSVEDLIRKLHVSVEGVTTKEELVEWCATYLLGEEL